MLSVIFQVPNATFDQIAVSDFAEQMTLIDHKLFCALDSEYVKINICLKYLSFL